MRTFILVSLIFQCIALEAQVAVKSYALKKGQIIDILLRSNNDKASQEVKDKFDRQVLPRALKYGYQFMPSGLYFDNVATQGNFSPEHMVIGGWKDLETRENAMRILVEEVPDFHQIRRELWTSLFATNFEVEKDVGFNIDQDKFYVVSTYMYKKKRPFGKFIKNLEENILESQGRIVLKLRDGISPFIGHYFEPNYFSITEWNSREEFKIFLSKNKKMNHAAVKYVNQFVLQPKF